MTKLCTAKRIIGAGLIALVLPVTVLAGDARFNEAGELIRPNVDDWVFVSVSAAAGADTSMMAAAGEGEKAEPAKEGDFHIIRMTRDAFAAYMETGEFPEGTMFSTSIFALSDEGSRMFGREVKAMEFGVKDSERFADGWAFYRFANDQQSAAAEPRERCFDCHAERGAVDHVFTQLYTVFRNNGRAGSE